jgi:hypothetical protein
MPSSVRLQSPGLCSGEWLEHSLRGVSAQEINISRPSVFDSAQAERVPASVGRHWEAARSNEKSRLVRSRGGGVRQLWEPLRKVRRTY